MPPGSRRRQPRCRPLSSLHEVIVQLLCCCVANPKMAETLLQIRGRINDIFDRRWGLDSTTRLEGEVQCHLCRTSTGISHLISAQQARKQQARRRKINTKLTWVLRFGFQIGLSISIHVKMRALSRMLREAPRLKIWRIFFSMRSQRSNLNGGFEFEVEAVAAGAPSSSDASGSDPSSELSDLSC